MGGSGAGLNEGLPLVLRGCMVATAMNVNSRSIGPQNCSFDELPHKFP